MLRLVCALVVIGLVQSALVKRGSDCNFQGKPYREGQTYRLYEKSSCVILRCEDGMNKMVRSACTDSSGGCHRQGEEWDEGCRSYRCSIHTYGDNGEFKGFKWTKHQPVLTRDNC